MQLLQSASAAEELFERDLVLEIRGSKKERRRAKKYAEGSHGLVMCKQHQSSV